MATAHLNADQTRPATSHDPLSGRFVDPASRFGVTEIHLPNGKTGYQVGEGGVIYADREVAVRHALCRRPKSIPTRARVRFDSSRPAKATKSRLAAFGRGVEPEATQTKAEPSEGQPEAPVSVVAKSRDLEDRRRRIQQRIADRESRVREAHRHAFGGEGTKAEREIAWPFFRFWDRRRRWVLRAYNRVVKTQTPFRDIRGDWTGD